MDVFLETVSASEINLTVIWYKKIFFILLKRICEVWFKINLPAVVAQIQFVFEDGWILYY